MWNGQTRLAHALLLEQHDVEVERARCPARRADASSVSFDSVERGEQKGVAGWARRFRERMMRKAAE